MKINFQLRQNLKEYKRFNSKVNRILKSPYGKKRLIRIGTGDNAIILHLTGITQNYDVTCQTNTIEMLGYYSDSHNV